MTGTVLFDLDGTLSDCAPGILGELRLCAKPAEVPDLLAVPPEGAG
jgi:phosphoglycolate phosphatase-like HAD superfamily hydrolase